MVTWLKTLITENDDDPGFANSVKGILIVILIVVILLALTQSGILSGSLKPDTLTILSVIAFLNGFFLFLAYRNILWPGKLFLPICLLLAITYSVITANGMHDVAMVGFPVVIFISSFLFGRRTLLFWALVTTACIGFIGYWDITGRTPEPIARTTGLDTIAIGILIVFSAGGLAYLLLRRFEGIIQQVRQSEREQIETNQKLRELQVSLEQHVDERTSELAARTVQLELANTHSQKRATQFKAIAQVGRTITSIQRLEELLPTIAQVTSEQLGFYHVGIFLLDKDKEYAVLSAANSEGGKRMLEHGHKLKVGQVGIVGYVASVGRPRIALDTGEDSAFFTNTDLPNTHSEMALPLQAGSETIGVLDVQSEHPDAFGQEDVELLTIMADQVSLAIQNSQSYEQMQKARSEAESISKQYLHQEWQSITQEGGNLGYRLTKNKLEPLINRFETADIIETAQSGQSKLVKDGAQNRLTIPVKLRGEVIGVLNLESKGGHIWKNDVIDIAQAIADRVALAIENARLLTSSQNQAARERTVGEITSKIGASVNLRNVLQTAVEELGRILPGSDVVIQIENKR
jgi:GAF domain-containing protein